MTLLLPFPMPPIAVSLERFFLAPYLTLYYYSLSPLIFVLSTVDPENSLFSFSCCQCDPASIC